MSLGPTIALSKEAQLKISFGGKRNTCLYHFYIFGLPV
jgi:hypothetical protein